MRQGKHPLPTTLVFPPPHSLLDFLALFYGCPSDQSRRKNVLSVSLPVPQGPSSQQPICPAKGRTPSFSPSGYGVAGAVHLWLCSFSPSCCPVLCLGRDWEQLSCWGSDLNAVRECAGSAVIWPSASKLLCLPVPESSLL